MRPHKAFTLIELLIVVAIIAILAAIAVPNFLEAQVRSKVSRTKADMRSVATALEAYVIDNNKYPVDYSDTLVGVTVANTFMGRLKYLTTPIAYITTLPEDFFAIKAAEGKAPTVSPAPYRQGGLVSGAVIRPVVYDYAKFDRSPHPYPDSISVWSEITSSPESVAWALNSPGPDISHHLYLGNSGIVIYDPTNGTVSRGQIIRTNISAEDKPKNL